MIDMNPREGTKLSSGFFHRFFHYTDHPDRQDGWVAEKSPRYGGVQSAKWRREQEGDWDVFGGERVWPMISKQFHNAVMILNEDWAVYRVIDHGIRHPTCCLWVGVNLKGDRHYFREYYATDKSIPLNCREIARLSPEPVIDTYIDPSTNKRINYLTTGQSVDKKGLATQFSIYEEHGIDCTKADNSAAGYDKVTNGLLSTLARWAIRSGQMPAYLQEMGINQEQLLLLADKPAITFDLRFTGRAFKETENLRWKQMTGDEAERDAPEKTVDVEDEGPDCVRYGMQSELYWRRPAIKLPRDSYVAQLARRQLKRIYKSHRKWA